jgi:hypothetical protein
MYQGDRVGENLHCFETITVNKKIVSIFVE